MVENVRMAEKAIGKKTFQLTDKQIKSKDFSRSIYVINDIKKGECFTSKNIKSIRPSFSLSPKYYKDVIGQTSKKNFEKGDRITLNDFELIILPFEKTVSSVLPPPTSTYK